MPRRRRREYKTGDGQINQPRPVQLRPEGRVQPVLGNVVPVLATKEIAHHRQTHGVIGVKDQWHHAIIVYRAGDDRRRNYDPEGKNPKPVPPGQADCRRRAAVHRIGS
jgi:hypothetical protein